MGDIFAFWMLISEIIRVEVKASIPRLFLLDLQTKLILYHISSNC